MNQEKIGKFIAKNRKDKGLTQEVLAEKLGISTNAVSKWERGLSFPDVSLFKKLCSELDISIEELINGEKSKSTESKDKAIIASLEEKTKIEKKSKKKILVLSIFILLIVTISIFYSSTLKINLINESSELYDIAIDYLRNKEFKSNHDSSKEDFNVFYSYHSFGIEKKGNYKYLYLWLYSGSYYLEEDDALVISTGSSLPVKITIKDNKVVNTEYPNTFDNEKKYTKKDILYTLPTIYIIPTKIKYKAKIVVCNFLLFLNTIIFIITPMNTPNIKP